MRPGVTQGKRKKIRPSGGRRRGQGARKSAKNEEGNDRCGDALHNIWTIRAGLLSGNNFFHTAHPPVSYIENVREINETEGVFYVCVSLIAHFVVFTDLLSGDSRSPASRVLGMTASGENT